MKGLMTSRHSLPREMLVLQGLTQDAAYAEHVPTAPLDVRAIYEANADFVWLTLQRFGVQERDLEDMLQEVFVVVHRRLDSFDPRVRMTTWLYGICLRVASGYRRKRRARPEEPVDALPTEATISDVAEGPEAALARCQA